MSEKVSIDYWSKEVSEHNMNMHLLKGSPCSHLSWLPTTAMGTMRLSAGAGVLPWWGMGLWKKGKKIKKKEKKGSRTRNLFIEKINKSRDLCFPNETHDSLQLLCCCFLVLSPSLLLLVHRLTFCPSYFFSALQKKEWSFKARGALRIRAGEPNMVMEQHNFSCLFYSRIQMALLKSEPFISKYPHLRFFNSFGIVEAVGIFSPIASLNTLTICLCF